MDICGWRLNKYHFALIIYVSEMLNAINMGNIVYK